MITGKNAKNSSKSSEQRKLAESRFREKSSEFDLSRPIEDVNRLVHELEVHQIELEMQNEELRQIRDVLDVSLEKFTVLYDFAPIGYFTLNRDGEIIFANMNGATLLGIDRSRLSGLSFSRFIDIKDLPLFSEFMQNVFTCQGKQSSKFTIINKSESPLFVLIEAVADPSGKESLLALIDITKQKFAENELQKAHDNLEIIVEKRTEELINKNEELLQEISEHKQSEESLKTAYLEIKQLKNRLLAENIYLQQEVARLDNFGEIIGQSSAISYVFSQIEQVAPINATVLLLGETGTGKGLVASAIHRRSLRKNKPMITVNCTALPGNLIESELFGREKGAFTGANERQMGRFELADGGTIFLDEIGEMPIDLQCKLLRVIQDGEFERLGSPRTIKVDVRIIAATNRNLEEEIRKGKFREDLYYRLNVFPISIPPLSKRKEDIPLLVNHFVSKFNKKIGKKIDSIPKEIVEMLSQYSWPGNIRELENVIERSVIITNGSVLQVLDRFNMPAKKEEQTGQEVKALIELEKDHILQVLQKTGWRIEGKNGAAVILGLNASTLRARMRKYGIIRL